VVNFEFGICFGFRISFFEFMCKAREPLLTLRASVTTYIPLSDCGVRWMWNILSLPTLSLHESHGDRGPVGHAPPVVNIRAAVVLIIQVVGVFPHIETHNRKLTRHERAVLIAGVSDLQLIVGPDQPGPAAAESAQAGGLEAHLECVEVGKSRV